MLLPKLALVLAALSGALTSSPPAHAQVSTLSQGPALGIFPDTVTLGPGYIRTGGDVAGISIGNNATEGTTTLSRGDASNPGGISFDLTGYTGGGAIGFSILHNRLQITNYGGSVTGWEFASTPYVGTSAIITANTGTSFAGGITSSSASAGIGYRTGAGLAATQSTSKTTTTSCSAISCAITTSNAALAATTTASFTVTNTIITATDVPVCAIKSGNATAGTYQVWPEAVAAGSFKLNIRNMSAGSLSEAIVINCVIIRGVAS